MLSSLSCFSSFQHSAIPISCHIFTVSLISLSAGTYLTLNFAITKQQKSIRTLSRLPLHCVSLALGIETID